jgi:hypothetical protein
MRIATIPVGVIALLASSGAVLSQTRDCNIEAFKAVQTEDSSEAVKLAQLKLVNATNYEEAKKSASASIAWYFTGNLHQRGAVLRCALDGLDETASYRKPTPGACDRPPTPSRQIDPSSRIKGRTANRRPPAHLT